MTVLLAENKMQAAFGAPSKAACTSTKEIV